MNTEKLQKAREFEQEQMKKISSEERPFYHVTGSVGWINDPNGFSYYKDEYHLFYQYHPYSNQWGPMHWGHLTSKDFISWKRLPVIMAPEESYDNAGCFSGSAIEMEDGRHLLMYTGVGIVKGAGVNENGDPVTHQTQCMAVGDGTDYVKYEKNPVITGNDVPEGGSKVDFRDPKIWKEEDGFYYSVITNMTEDGNSRILLYRSKDGFKWEYVTVIDHSDEKLGKMWECPDFYEVDGKQILVVSPMAMLPEGLKFHVGHSVIYLTGSYDKTTHTFVREDVQPLDSGIDFYAPQSMLTPDGRRVMIAWMQAWPNSKFVPDGVKYFGQMTVPREINYRNGKLIQQPVRELENYRGERVLHENVEITEETTLEGIRGRVLDMTVKLNVTDELKSFTIKAAADEKYASFISYDAKKEVLTIDRSRSGYLYDILHSRDIQVSPVDGKVILRILMDRFSMEIFINDGSQTATMVIFTPQEADEITFQAEGKAEISIEKYDLIF